MALGKASLIYLLVLALSASSVTGPVWAGGTMKVPLTPERIEACRRLLTEKGIDLPPGAQITGIEVHAEDWVCTSCSKTVDGIPANFPHEAAQCDGCGSPMEPRIGELYKENKDGQRVFRDDQIAAALNMGEDGGANWSCNYCGTGGNRHKVKGEIVKECRNCGAERADYSDYDGKNTDRGTENKKEVNGKIVQTTEFQKPEIPKIDVSQKDPSIADFNENKSTMPKAEPEILSSSDPAATLKPQVERVVEARQKGGIDDFKQILIKNKKGVAIGGGIVLGLFTYLTLKDKEIKGKITSARWIQTVRVEQFQPVIERGRKSDLKESEPVMPVNGEGGKPGVKIIECTGNTCLYETYKWIEVDSKVMRGNYDQQIPGNPAWAQLEAPANGRVSTNTRYDVDFEFSHNGEKFSAEWRPDSFKDFQSFKPGSEIIVQVDPLSNVQKITKGAK